MQQIQTALQHDGPNHLVLWLNAGGIAAAATVGAAGTGGGCTLYPDISGRSNGLMAEFESIFATTHSCVHIAQHTT